MLLVADFNTNTVRKVSASGAVTTIAGNGEIGFADGQGAEARFNAPHGIAVVLIKTLKCQDGFVLVNARK
jgi:hypothetical protein